MSPPTPPSSPSCSVAAFYRFAPLGALDALRTALQEEAARRDLRGTVLLAAEGINGALAGRHDDVLAMLDVLRRVPGLAALEARFTNATETPFRRFKVKLKREIVTLGLPALTPPRRGGERVDPRAWDRLLRDPEVTVIDTRNDYEYALGTFVGAINPATRHFREFPAFVATHLAADRDRPVAMFCTGGIRCEKASAYLLEQGFTRVYQLEGGILRYLAESDPADSAWRGDCFVFDERVALDAHLQAADYEQCAGCRRPVGAAARAGVGYEPGVSCPACHATLDPQHRRRRRERARQVRLAAARGAAHLGALMPAPRAAGDAPA